MATAERAPKSGQVYSVRWQGPDGPQHQYVAGRKAANLVADMTGGRVYACTVPYTTQGLADFGNRRVLQQVRTPPRVPVVEGEIWRPIPGVSEAWVSTLGRVARLRGPLTLSRHKGSGPLRVEMAWGRKEPGKQVKTRNFGVAQLVLETFAQPVEGPGWMVAYRDGDDTNVALENLYWRRAVKYLPRSERPQKAGKPKPAPPPPLGEGLRRSLSFNGAWAAADRAVSKALPRHVRDDVISDMVVAHLAGELELDAITTAAGAQFVRAHYRQFGSLKTVSLDAPIPGTDGLRLLDTLEATP